MKHVFLFILPIIAMILSLQSRAADFEGQTEFTHFDLSGLYSVTCYDRGERKYALHQCRGYLLNPFGWAHFHHDPQGEVDRVELSTVNKEGKQIRKKSAWDTARNRSEKEINLWTWTVFQRPLLEIGENQVRYSLSKQGRTVENGSFQVIVHDGGARSCRERSTSTGSAQLCDSYAIACDEYFRLENNCVYP